jgi:hypothetical protein
MGDCIMPKIKKLYIIALIVSHLVSCGPNPFASYETKDPGEDATVALEDGNPNKAINILTDALKDEPENWQWVSILALAYAERAGINALTLAQKMASNSGGQATTSSNEVTALFSILPEATDSNINDVDEAVALMLKIPALNRTTADVLKIAMFQTASLTLRTKKLDTNGDGIISVSELLGMSSGDALTILTQLASAAAAFAGGDPSSSTDQAAAAQISTIQSAIGTCPGASQEDKLKNYLSKTGC